MRFFGVDYLAASLQLWASASALPPPLISSSNSASRDWPIAGFNYTASFSNTLLNSSSSTVSNASSRDFPDPFEFVVDSDRLTIEFYGYRNTVDSIDLRNCVDSANADIKQKMAAYQMNTLMGTDLHVWSSSNTELSLVPGEQMTWNMWKLVPRATQWFAIANGLKGTQFVLLWLGLGPVGYGQLIKTTEPQSPKPTTTTTTTTDAFPDPYDKVIDSIGLTIEFYGYQGSIPPLAMQDCIEAATRDVNRHIVQGEAPQHMDAPSYSYSAGGVNLFLCPGESLTWHMWTFVPVWIQAFVTENEFKGTQFALLWEGFGPVGSGHLVGAPPSPMSH